jgi:hypothetical protein
MTGSIDTLLKRRLSAKLPVGIAISPLLVLGALVKPARADWDGHNREYRDHN